MDETALDLLEAAYNHALPTVDEGQARLLFRANDAANALGLTTAQRDTPEAEAYRRAISLLVGSGAVLLADIGGQAQVGEEFYEITTCGGALLREAGRIA